MERKPKRDLHKYNSSTNASRSSVERLFDVSEDGTLEPVSKIRPKSVPKKPRGTQKSFNTRTTEVRNKAVSKKTASRSSSPKGSKKSSGARLPASLKASGKKRNRKNKLSFLLALAALVVIAVIIILLAVSAVPEAKKLTIRSTDNSQILTWERNGKNLSYEVYRKGTEDDFSLVRTIGEEDATSYTAESLNSATLYQYKIVAVKGKKKSKGATIESMTIPVIAENLTANTQVENSLTLVWEDIQKVNGYEIRFGSSNDLSDATTTTVSLDGVMADDTTGLRSYTYDNLEEGALYYFSIRSFCDKDLFSDWTSITSARVTRAIDMTGINLNAPMVAITFDDGPDGSDVTTRILDAFAANGGHATFFQLGDHIELNPEKSQRMVAEGHEIGNHSYDHTHMGGAVTSEDITRANDSIEAVCGIRPYVFRCPGGESTDLIVDTCISEDMAIFHWSLDTRDWSSRDADAVISEIKNNVQDGDIILMHNIYSSTADAVEQILPWLTEQGYQLVTVSQLIQAKNNEPPVTGVTYKRADYSW